MSNESCQLCELGICPQSGLTLKQLRRRLARLDNKRKSPKLIPIQDSEICPWCKKLIPVGVNYCPEFNCGELIRFTITNADEMFNYYQNTNYN